MVFLSSSRKCRYITTNYYKINTLQILQIKYLLNVRTILRYTVSGTESRVKWNISPLGSYVYRNYSLSYLLTYFLAVRATKSLGLVYDRRQFFYLPLASISSVSAPINHFHLSDISSGPSHVSTAFRLTFKTFISNPSLIPSDHTSESLRVFLLNNRIWGSQRWLWRVMSSGIRRRVLSWMSTDVSEEHVTSIFRVEYGGTRSSEISGWLSTDYAPSYPWRENIRVSMSTAMSGDACSSVRSCSVPVPNTPNSLTGTCPLPTVLFQARSWFGKRRWSSRGAGAPQRRLVELRTYTLNLVYLQSPESCRAQLQDVCQWRNGHSSSWGQRHCGASGDFFRDS
jgi:hypothetical protein